MDLYHYAMTPTGNTILVPKPDIFSFTECLHFLDRGYDDCLYTLGDDRVLKPLRIEGERVLFQIREVSEALEIEVVSGNSSREMLEKAARYATEWFDLDRDLKPYYRQLEGNERLSWMADRFYGLRLMGIPDLFEALCWCVIGQQINLAFAYRLKRNLVERYGHSISGGSKRHFYFPEPELLAGLKTGDLRDLQFSRRKAEYIIGIANEFSEGNITKKSLNDYPETRQMLDRLMEIRGVGEWTANYVLMKSLKRLDCITFGDTGLQSAVSSLLGLKRKPAREEIESVFEPFAGWESYLVIYLWRTLS